MPKGAERITEVAAQIGRRLEDRSSERETLKGRVAEALVRFAIVRSANPIIGLEENLIRSVGVDTQSNAQGHGGLARIIEDDIRRLRHGLKEAQGREEKTGLMIFVGQSLFLRRVIFGLAQSGEATTEDVRIYYGLVEGHFFRETRHALGELAREGVSDIGQSAFISLFRAEVERAEKLTTGLHSLNRNELHKAADVLWNVRSIKPLCRAIHGKSDEDLVLLDQFLIRVQKEVEELYAKKLPEDAFASQYGLSYGEMTKNLRLARDLLKDIANGNVPL